MIESVIKDKNISKTSLSFLYGVNLENFKNHRAKYANIALNYTAIIFAFGLPLSRGAISIGTALLLIFWILEGDYKNKYNKIKSSKVHLFILLFIAYLFLSFLWSDNLNRAFKNILNYVYYFPHVFILFTSLQKKYIPMILSAFLAGIFLSEIISYGIFFEWWHKEGVSPTNPSPYMHHISYSIFLAFASLLILNRIFLEQGSKIIKTILWLFFFTVTTNLFINGGRTGQLAFSISIFLLIFLHIKFSLKNILISIITVFSLLIVAYLISPVFKNKVNLIQTDLITIKQSDNYDTSIGGRIAMQKVAISIIKENPIFGVGIGDDTKSVFAKTQEKGFEKFTFINRYTHLHNQYLQTLVQGGLIALILLLLIFYYIIKFKSNDKEATNLAIVLIFIYLIGFSAEPLLARQFPISLFTFITGVILSMKKHSLDTKTL